MPVEDFLPEWESYWEEAEHDGLKFFELVWKAGLIDDAMYWDETSEILGGPPPPPPPVRIPEEDLRQGVGDALFDKISDWFTIAWQEFLKGLWSWLRENIADFVDIVGGHLKAAFEQYWPPVESAIEAAGEKIFDLTMKGLLHGGTVTPESAPGLAAKMFGVALGAGITAHAMSVGFEMIHPFKSLGFHQMTGMIAQLGSFGPVSAATLGQVHYAALRLPMSYACNKVTRSRLPDDMVLQILAVKPDISMEQFVETMKYHGYSDYWIDRIRATMYHEPRYFELKMMSEDETAAKPPSDVSEMARAEFVKYGVTPQDQWLFMKSRRAGFSPADSKVMVSSYVKGAVRDQRKEYYKQGFNLFKEGYIQSWHFHKILDDLGLRPEATTLAARGAELAYLFDTISDEKSYWTDCYLKDLVTDDELELQLSLLGVNRWRVDLMVRRAKVRKYKKPGKPVPTEIEKAMNQARSKYSQAYIILYRKDQIDIDTLCAYLVEIGIEPVLAESTCFLEQARKMEKEVIV